MKPRSYVLVGVLAVVFACRPPDPPVPPTSALLAPEVETREVQLDDDFVTVRLHIPPTPEPRKPTVVSMLGDRASFLRQGVLVATYRINWELRKPASPPAPPPENTIGKWVLASPSAAVLGREYLRVIATTANHVIPRMLDYLTTVPEVDPARIAIAGASTNGFIALQAVARDRRLSAAVVLAGCGDYHRFLRFSSMGMDGRPLELAPDYERWLRTQEVVRRPRRVVHAAVLMVNRDKDPVIPFACVQQTARALRRAYVQAGVPERFRFVAIEDERHGLDQRDAEETLAWLYRWLRTPGRARPATDPGGHVHRGRSSQ
jgi:dienelactone hydrolase